MYPEPVLLQFEGSVEMKHWIELFNQCQKRAQMNKGCIFFYSIISTLNWKLIGWFVGALNRRRSSADTDMSSDIGSIKDQVNTSTSDLFIYDIAAH